MAAVTIHLQIVINGVDPIVGQLQRDDEVVGFTGWLAFFRAVSDAIGAAEPLPAGDDGGDLLAPST